MRIVVSGAQGSGKSTVVQKVRLRLPPAAQFGLLTRPVFENGALNGFYMESFAGERKLFAHGDFNGSRRFGRLGVCLEVFDRLGTEIVSRAAQSEFAVLDELGIMEMEAFDFVRSVVSLFAAPRHVLAVVQQRALSFWKKKIGERNIDRLHLLDRENRDILPDRILEDLNPSPAK